MRGAEASEAFRSWRMHQFSHPKLSPWVFWPSNGYATPDILEQYNAYII